MQKATPKNQKNLIITTVNLQLTHSTTFLEKLHNNPTFELGFSLHLISNVNFYCLETTEN